MSDKKSIAIKRSPVNSGNIVSVGYDEATKTLDVEFYTGKLYRYDNVPREMYESMLVATSVGSYFQRNIARVFPYKNII